jgi:methylenetetrahydrofolate dehydrogenase (NADP+)/methenyltetrahydrofolate cyclohydrolase
MAEILKGAPIAAAMNEKTAREVAELKAMGTEPTLAVVRVGNREDDIAYERGAIKQCEAVGIHVRPIALPAESSEDALIAVLRDLNADKAVHGVLLFRPLPAHIDDDRVRNALAPEKDVDGITDLSLAGVFAGTGAGYAPCTARACMELLDRCGIDPNGKKAVVVGRSLVVGKPVAMILLERNATVTICHTGTRNLPAECREAELLIVCAGHAGIADADCFSPGQTVVDVGVNILPGGGLCGDVDTGAARDIVKAVTPVPGGVGTVTTSVLAAHVADAARRSMAGGR